MRKKLLIMLMVMGALLPQLAFGYDVEINGIYYNLNSEYKVAEVTSGDSQYTGKVVIPSIVSYEGVTYSVTSIGTMTFYYCSSLTSVTIPNSVTSIGMWAFWYCYGLISIDIPNSVTSIGNSAFDGCTSLTSVTNLSTTPQVITSHVFTTYGTLHVIPGYGDAYRTADEWKNFTIVEDVPATASGDCGVEGDNVKWYYYEDAKLLVISGSGAMADYSNGSTPWNSFCESIESVDIQNGVTSIGARAFQSCGLTSLDIPNSVTSIGEYAINSCENLESVRIGRSVSSIGEGAFVLCPALATISVDSENPTYNDMGNTIIETSTGTLVLGCKNTKIPQTVTSIGYGAFGGCTDLKEIEIPSSVTSIAKFAFYGCDKLISVEIPNSVISIGELAFESCTGLTSVIIGNSVTSLGFGAFRYCTSLTSVTLPSSMTSILPDAFGGCTNLTSVTNLSTTPQTNTSNVFTTYGTLYVPKGAKAAYEASEYWNNFTIEELGFDAEIDGIYYVFNDEERTAEVTSAIESNPYIGDIEIPSTVTKDDIEYTVKSIGEAAFYNCSGLTSVTIPNSVTSIGAQAFHSCGLISLDIPNSVTSIGEYAINSCNKLESVRIGSSVSSIGKFAFAICPALATISVDYGNTTYADLGNAIIEPATKTLIAGCKNTTIPYSVTCIGPGAFAGSKNLTEIEIPSSVTIIEDNAFAQCDNLTSIDIPNSVTSIGRNAFEYCYNLSSVTIGNSVTTIGYMAFYNCNSLSSLILGSSITNIDDFAFAGCRSLLSVNLPGSLRRIGFAAFNDTNLSIVTIPNSVTSIGALAFYGCDNLTSVTNLSTTPQTITSNVFTTYGTLYVPKGAKAAYEASDNWKNFTIEELRFNAEIDDGLYYVFNDEDRTAEVTSAIESNPYSGDIVIPSTVTKDDIEYTVKSIGKSAFENCSGLTSVTIPNSVTSIGNYAFEDCI